jgi:alkylation response protein AidB-like acyl-CoA dehydrogenase
MRSASCGSTSAPSCSSGSAGACASWTRTAITPHDIHETLAREGLMGLALPAEFGGREAPGVAVGADA